jgi:hypothetical protein
MPMYGRKEDARVALDNCYCYAPRVIWRLVGATLMSMIFLEVFELQATSLVYWKVKAINFNWMSQDTEPVVVMIRSGFDYD